MEAGETPMKVFPPHRFFPLDLNGVGIVDDTVQDRIVYLFLTYECNREFLQIKQTLFKGLDLPNFCLALKIAFCASEAIAFASGRFLP